MHAIQKWKRGTMREVSEEKSLGLGLSFFPRKMLLFFFLFKVLVKCKHCVETLTIDEFGVKL